MAVPAASRQASLARMDVRTNAQYFVATLAEFRVGDTVEYIGVATWPGGQAPSPGEASTFPSSFQGSSIAARVSPLIGGWHPGGGFATYPSSIAGDGLQSGQFRFKS